MNKNQLVLIIMVVMFSMVGIFMFVVFNSDDNDSIEESLQDADGEYLFEIDGDTADYVEIENVDSKSFKNTASASVSVSENDIVQIKEKQVQNNNTESQGSPETGPGFVAMLIATVVAIISAVFIYKKQGKKNIL